MKTFIRRALAARPRGTTKSPSSASSVPGTSQSRAGAATNHSSAARPQRPILLSQTPGRTAPASASGAFFAQYMAKAAVALASLFSGAALVHGIVQPDLTIPDDPEELVRRRREGSA
jgi:hypothetical protein